MHQHNVRLGGAMLGRFYKMVDVSPTLVTGGDIFCLGHSFHRLDKQVGRMAVVLSGIVLETASR